MIRALTLVLVCLVGGACTPAASALAPTPTVSAPAPPSPVPCAGGSPCPTSFPSDVRLEGNHGLCLQAADMWRMWTVEVSPVRPHALEVTAYRSLTPGCESTAANPTPVAAVGGTLITDRGTATTVYLLHADLQGAGGASCGRTQYELRVDGALVARALVDGVRPC